MSHQLHNYLAQQLDRALRKDRVVVFYDARSEFEPFIAELDVVGTGLGSLPRTAIGDTLAHMARLDGSFFDLKASIEPVVSADTPEPLLIYVPGQARDRAASVLMEVERAGQVYGDAPSHALKSVARRLLQKEYTDGDIDEMLRHDSLCYEDVTRFLSGASSGTGSLLKLVLSGSSSEDLITDWIVSPDKDEALASKLAEPELFRLVDSRLAFEIDEGTPLEKARYQTVRYLLVNEFRSDLSCEAPDALGIVPTPRDKDNWKHVTSVIGALRGKHGKTYFGLADDIEKEFGLANASIDPATLGAIDTFRFEERRLLHYAASLITDGRSADALEVIAGRGHSFWIDHPGFLDRLAQWEACRLMAELCVEAGAVRPALSRTPPLADAWIDAYSREGGWHCVDRAQRALEAWVASMEDDPEEPLRQALTLARQKHEALLGEMAAGFTQALKASAWTTTAALHQTHIYPELVESRGGRVAYFFVDAMRFEMGVDLLVPRNT